MVEKKIRVLVADSRTFIREALAKVLADAANIKVVSLCSNGEDTIQQAINLKPDVILLDGGLSGDCVKVARHIRKSQPEIRIIIFTPTSYQSGDTSFVLNAGADGYVDIDIHPLHLIEIINRVYNGNYVLSLFMPEKLRERLAFSDEKPSTPQEISLSKREREVLDLVSKGLTNKEIADKLFISERTAKAHLHSILTKMQAHSRTQAAFMARDMGILSSKDSQNTY